MAATIAIQHARTTNDANGNPRRCWVFYRLRPEKNQALRVAVVDEGYEHDRPESAFRALGLNADDFNWVQLQSINISPTEYRALIKNGEEQDSRLPYAVRWVNGGEIYAYHRTLKSAQKAAREWNRITTPNNVEAVANDPTPIDLFR